MWSNHWWCDMDFWVWLINQAPELSMKVSDIAKEGKIVTLITFFGGRGIVHSEFLLLSQTINQKVYKEILQYIFHSVCKKRWVVAEQIMTASLWQCTCSQYSEHPVLSQEEYLHIHLMLLHVTFSSPKL